MLKRKNFERRKVNCICRCKPQDGITVLYPPMLERTMRKAIHTMRTSRSTGVIAATAVRAGQLFENTGHVLKAITIYRIAINIIMHIDSDRAYDYYDFGPLPANPHFRYWSERINDADALEVARCLDGLYIRLNLKDKAHQQHRIKDYYECLFLGVYSACM